MADSKKKSSELNSSDSDDICIIELPSPPRRRAFKTLLFPGFRCPMADSKRNSTEQNSTVSDYVDAEESSSAQKRRAIENVLSDAFLSTVNSTMESPSCVSDDLAIIEPSSPPKRRAIKTLLPAAFRIPMADSKSNSSEQNSTVSDYVDAEESSSAQKRRAIENVLSDAFLSTVNSTMESPSCVSDDLAIIEPSSLPKRRAIKTLLPAAFLSTVNSTMESPSCVSDDLAIIEPSSLPKRRAIKTLLPAVRRNPRRAVPIRNYFEGNKPSVLPKNSYKASLEDNPVPVGSTDRARKTVPRRILAVRYSNIHGYGVFAVKNLKTGIRMGPYEGIRTEVKTETGYAWALSDGTFIDATDETTSNYLRFVNCARTEKEENLEAFEFNGELYYKTKKNIVKGEELLIFYGVSFAKHLGIDMKKYYSEEGAKIVSRPSSRRKSASTSESESRVECRSIKSLIEIQCEDCEYKSWDPEDMANHRVAEHEDENSTWYSCSLCDFHTCSRADLGRHSNSHIL